MASFRLCLTGLFCLLGTVSCQLVTLGGCPDVPLQENFDLTKYLGKWYEFRRYTTLFSLFANCVTAEYLPKTSTSVQVNNTGWKYLSDYYDTAIGDAVVMEGAKLGVRFSDAQPYGDYWVVSTDYTSYSIVWSCTETPKGPIRFNSQFLWLLTRNPGEMSKDRLDSIMNLLKGYNINVDLRKLQPSSQLNCPGRQYGVNM